MHLSSSASSPITPRSVPKTSSRCSRLDNRNSNKHQTPYTLTKHITTQSFGLQPLDMMRLFFYSYLKQKNSPVVGAPEIVACHQNRRQGSCEWLHFMIQDHHNAFDATPQSPGEGAFHNSASKFFLDVPLVVGLSTSNHGTLFTEYVGENGGKSMLSMQITHFH